MSGSSPNRRRAAMALRIVLIFGSLFSFGYFVVRPKLLALAAIDRDVTLREAQAARKRADFARVQRFHEKEEKDVERREQALKAAVPPKGSSGISDILDATATACRLQVVECRVLEPLVQLEPAPEGSGDRYYRVPIEAELRGRYKEVPAFLEKVATDERAIRLEGIEVFRDEAIFPDVKIKIRMRSFFAEPTAAEAGG